MVFAGEASWRWKMLVASTDRAYEFFWRQAARWLARPSPDPVALTIPDTLEPGDSVPIALDVRDAAFAAVPDATIDAELIPPGGDSRALKLRAIDRSSGRFTTAVRLDEAGLYRVRAQAHRGATALGSADHWFYVGGADREFADPRLNDAFLRRIARSSGGRYVRASEAGRLTTWLQAAVPQAETPEQRDLWHAPWAFAIVVMLLSAEWILRRRWGLR
jgi:hypothetical protein